MEEVAFTGRVVYIGYVKDPVAYETRLFIQKELDILGLRNALPKDFTEVIRMLEDYRFLDAWSANPVRFAKIMVRLE